MNQSNFKAILFRMDGKKENVFRYNQLIEFIKKLGRPNLKIGLLLSEKKRVYPTSETNPFIQAAHKIGASPAETMILLTKSKDIQSARDSGFALIVGYKGEEEELYLFKKGADILIQELPNLNGKWIDHWFNRQPPYILKPTELSNGENIKISLHPRYLSSPYKLMKKGKKTVFFFDYDGTLTPIVQQPDLARLSSEMREIIWQLSRKYKLAIVSGRERKDLQALVDIPEIFYAGNHGLDIVGPGISMIYPKVKKYLPVIENVSTDLVKILSTIPGVIIEKKNISVAVHYRQVSKKDLPSLRVLLKNILKEEMDHIQVMKGKKVVEILPNIEWNKGKAVLWIMDVLGLNFSENMVFYLGDDTTDEDAFRILRTRGTGIFIADKDKISAADYRLSSPSEVKYWLEQFLN